jgi:hypothetical protein
MPTTPGLLFPPVVLLRLLQLIGRSLIRPMTLYVRLLLIPWQPPDGPQSAPGLARWPFGSAPTDQTPSHPLTGVVIDLLINVATFLDRS